MAPLSVAWADVEPNNTIGSAEPLPVGTTGVGGRISPSGDEDYYRFAGIAGRTYVAEVLNVASGLGSMMLHGYNASGSTLAYTTSCNGSGNVCARIQFTTSLDGTYFLRARAGSTTTSGTYTIRLIAQ